MTGKVISHRRYNALYLSDMAAEMSDVSEEEGGHSEYVRTRHQLEDTQEYIPTVQKIQII